MLAQTENNIFGARTSKELMQQAKRRKETYKEVYKGSEEQCVQMKIQIGALERLKKSLKMQEGAGKRCEEAKEASGNGSEDVRQHQTLKKGDLFLKKRMKAIILFEGARKMIEGSIII